MCPPFGKNCAFRQLRLLYEPGDGSSKIYGSYSFPMKILLLSKGTIITKHELCPEKSWETGCISLDTALSLESIVYLDSYTCGDSFAYKRANELSRSMGNKENDPIQMNNLSLA